MSRSALGRKLVSSDAYLLALETLRNFILKLLDSADLTDKSSSKLFVFLEQKALEYSKTCDKLRDENKQLQDENDALNDTLSRVRDDRSKLTEQIRQLQQKLDVIRDVLRDNDIDKAKNRLAELEDMCFLSSLTPKKTCVETSAGSSELDGDRPSLNPRESKSRNGILRRSERLSSAKRNSLSFLHMKAATMGDALNTSITSLFRKRQSSSCSSSYQDIAFKKFAMDESFSYIPQTVPEDAVSMISTTNDDTDALKDTTVFRTPSRPVVSHSRLTRAHHFEPISTLRLQTCSCCGKRLALRKPVLRCRTCRLVVHHSCQAQLKQRCVPPTDLPTSPRTPECRTPRTPANDIQQRLVSRTPRGRHSNTGTLRFPSRSSPTNTAAALRRRLPAWHSLDINDLCPPNEFPMIPATVIHCVNEVAARGLIQTGIYRVPGAEKRVLELLDKFFYSKATPSLALIDDINVVCSCLKSFLRMLSEPLVTFAMRPGFLEAAQLAEKGDAEAAKYRVASLLDAMPIPNRDTLAFIILHLQAVSRAPMCKMDAVNLSKVFGYTLVGNSRRDLPLDDAVGEVGGQYSIVRLLLSVPDAVFSTIIA